MKTLKRLVALGFLGASVFVTGSVFAESEIVIRIKDHKFEPSVVNVPAGEKIKLVVHNDDPSPEEFESHKLNREKVIQGGSKAVILIGPLEEGAYPFFGEFNESTAKGQIIAKDANTVDGASGGEDGAQSTDSIEPSSDAVTFEAPPLEGNQ